MRLSPIRDAERLKRKSISLLLSLSATSSSSSSPSPAEAAAQKSKNSNRQQQCPPSQPLIVSKSKIDSQIKQLEKQQQQQRSKAASSPSSTAATTKLKRNSNNHNRNRCSIPQNKKRTIRHLYTKAKSLEKSGLWREASNIYEYIVTKLSSPPYYDAHSYLAWGRLESRRERGGYGNISYHSGSGGNWNGTGRRDDQVVDETTKAGEGGDDSLAHTVTTTKTTTKGSSIIVSKASTIFQNGTKNCPTSTHLYHGWALHEQYTLGNTNKARQLLQIALDLDPNNGYVCHAYGLIEYHCGEITKAKSLWQQGLAYHPSAALVCSLGEMYVSLGDFFSARELYSTYLPKLLNGRERTEVYLAAASLEERIYNDVEMASELLRRACSEGGGGSSSSGSSSSSSSSSMMDGRAYVALARLGSGGGLVDDSVVKKRLKEICMRQLDDYEDKNNKNNNSGNNTTRKKNVAFPVNDGRLFNAWAKLESKAGNLSEARKILGWGMRLYPKDYTLLQAAGNIEERIGNIEPARDLYGASLMIEPSAPTLISYALLELRSPIDAKVSNITMVRKLFEEALLIDPKHGPAYNAFGNLERRQGNTQQARQIYENGIKANCTDAPSVYHGLAKLHLSLGEIEKARDVLQRALALFEVSDNLVQRKENVAFLAHTLAMIDLNVNNNVKHAKEVLQQGLWHCPKSPQLLLAMALCESRLGNEIGARDMFEKSLMADQTHAQAWQAFGVMEMKAGNFRSAKLLFECGLKNSPSHGALWQAYGESIFK
jgi:tetratricopeptide (TPR) repeat protein